MSWFKKASHWFKKHVEPISRKIRKLTKHIPIIKDITHITIHNMDTSLAKLGSLGIPIVSNIAGIASKVAAKVKAPLLAFGKMTGMSNEGEAHYGKVSMKIGGKTVTATNSKGGMSYNIGSQPRKKKGFIEEILSIFGL